MRNRKRTGWHRYINIMTVATTVTVLFVVLPLYWMISSSFKGPAGFGWSRPTGNLRRYSWMNAFSTGMLIAA